MGEAPKTRHCRDCVYRSPAGREPDYGYCRAGATPLDRARLIFPNSVCWLTRQCIHVNVKK
jgi:hypothetical protein